MDFIALNCRKDEGTKHYIPLESISQIFTNENQVFIDLKSNTRIFPKESKDVILHMINVSNHGSIVDEDTIQSMYEQQLMWEQTSTSFYNNNLGDEELPF